MHQRRSIRFTKELALHSREQNSQSRIFIGLYVSRDYVVCIARWRPSDVPQSLVALNHWSRFATSTESLVPSGKYPDCLATHGETPEDLECSITNV